MYTPDSSVAKPREMLRDMFRDLARSGDLAWRLAVRDIQAQYRQNVLGILWAFITPLFTTLTWIFLQGSGIVAVGATDIPYPVYVFTGTMLWAIFTDAMNAPMNQTQSASGLLAKFNFPREALIVSGIYKILFNAGIKILLMLGALVIIGIYPGWHLLIFPLGIVSLILVGTALGLLVTPIGMLYKDVGRVIPLGLQFLMYLTPVVFAMPKDGWVATLFQINPLTPLILNARNWLTGFPPEQMTYFVIVNLLAVLMLLIAWGAYRLVMPILIERTGA
ncbi:ABC transporter permease [Thiocapsa imhoffii]|uniref:ABC transporter permease n=1 Tax=Thiocapsa imhoffii TaxID=382777 RepID=UPI0030B897D1